ncbi:Allophanate hydrolase 2 subunit 2 [Lactiplantibacillus plantarum]|uniref:Allophanate hydrolase 2 subunit 2 n=1 Tax=Lactiplantibacillus plantarum TaxID=1590 RepID=A0A165RX76_LACPN|nr:Allophanate hydrolase 2 subunit 2 [Lactiplantibacillus plantarum]
MDQWSAIQGNLLVNNVENEAVLEYSILGPTVTFSTPAVIAVTGGVVNAKLNGTQIHENQAIEVNSEDVLEIGPLTQGRYGYLAVSGGLQVDSILASKATSLRYGLGGFKGRALKRGIF